MGPRMIFFTWSGDPPTGRSKFCRRGNWTAQCNVKRENVARGVDVSNRRQGDWIHLQWVLCTLTQRMSPFSAIRGGDAALPKLLWEDLLRFLLDGLIITYFETRLVEPG